LNAKIAKDAKNILERAKKIFAVFAGFGFFRDTPGDRATKTFVLTTTKIVVDTGRHERVP